MRKRNTALTVSPTEQMYFVNRNTGLGDPVTSAIVSAATTALNLFKKLFGGGGDPYRDIHIPAQNAAHDGFASILNILSTKQANGSLTSADITQARASVQQIDGSFHNFVNSLSAQHPSDANRYQAGYNDIHNLEQQILATLTPAHYGIPDNPGIVDSITNAFTNPQGGISTTGLIALAAGFFFLPNLLKTLKRG